MGTRESKPEPKRTPFNKNSNAKYSTIIEEKNEIDERHSILEFEQLEKECKQKFDNKKAASKSVGKIAIKDVSVQTVKS